MLSRELVPGDLIELKLGDIVPADAMLLAGMPLQVGLQHLPSPPHPLCLHGVNGVRMRVPGWPLDLPGHEFPLWEWG